MDRDVRLAAMPGRTVDIDVLRYDGGSGGIGGNDRMALGVDAANIVRRWTGGLRRTGKNWVGTRRLGVSRADRQECSQNEKKRAAL